MPITREAYIEKYGVDPQAIQPVDDSSTGLKPDYFAKSVVTGIPTIVTDFINLPSTISDAATATYRSFRDDTKWTDEFQKNIMVEGASDNIQQHFNNIAQSWKSQKPDMTKEEIDAGLAEYQKTKMYDDFILEQKRGTHYLAAKAKDTMRHLLGDQRSEAQRSWTDDVGEVVGGAFVGGPAGLITKGAAKIPGVAAATNNAVGRGALRTVEAFTPLTMPYTGTNIAINAAAGSALNQGVRYLQGQSTVFTPTPEDTASVGTLGGITAATGAAAMIVSAMKGRTAALLKTQQTTPSHVDTTLKNIPVLDYAVKEGDTVGEAFMIGGPDAQRGPTSYMETLTAGQQIRRTARRELIDEGSTLSAAIRDIHGSKVADDMTGLRTGNTGPVLADAINGRVSESLQKLIDIEATMHPDKLRSTKQAHWMNSYSSDISTTHDALLSEIQEISERIQRGRTSPQRNTADTKKLAELQSDLQRLINDDESARPRVPIVPMARVHQMGNAFVADPDPQVTAYRNAVKAFNKEMLDLDVKSERISQQAADIMHVRNPYYVQAKDDPFGSLTGTDRMWTSVIRGIRNKTTRQSEGTGSGALSESPLRHLSKDVQPIKQAGDPETRITTPMDVASVMKEYSRRTHVDHAHTTTRNELLRALHTGPDGNPSFMVTRGHMRAVKNELGGGTWFEGNQLRTPELRAKLDSPNVADEWDKGRVRLWEFGDADIARAIRMEPIILSGLMKGVAVTSNVSKFWTTGRGSWFAPLGAMYNMGIAAHTSLPNRVFGPVQTAAKRYAPEWFAKEIIGRLPKWDALAVWPYYVVRSLAQLQAYHLTRPIARELTKVTPFAALQKAVGPRAYQAMVNKMLQIATIADQTHGATLKKAGATFGAQSIDNIAEVRDAFTTMQDKVPRIARLAWQFYTDVLDSFWMAEKLQYYTQNHAILSHEFKGKIPQAELNKIINEARTLAGDMSLRPANEATRNVEALMPYLSQTKLGTFHLLQHTTSKDTWSYTVPKLMITMAGVAQSIYMMTYWDKAASKAYWEEQPEHERYQYIWIPTPTTIFARLRGEHVPYTRDAVYRIRLPPDFAGIVAGTAAMMQMMGLLPADATPRPISGDVHKVFMDSVTPVMPPLAQAVLAQSNMKLDPASSETRGGNWIRTIGSTFKNNPQAEAATNLGQVSNSTTLTMSALFGALGGHVAQGIDVMMHAAKYHPQIGPNNQVIPRQTPDYFEGLKKATSHVFSRNIDRIPDVPLIWQNKARYVATTPAWTFVAENTSHIRSIIDTGNDALKKAANEKRAAAVKAGGIPTQGISDVVLAQISQDVAAWDAPTGLYGKLKKQYSDLAADTQALNSQYNLPQDQKSKLVNENMMKQQAVKKQQQLAIQYAEQIIAQKYGMALKPLLKGRYINMKTIDELMRENVSAPAAAQADRQQVQ